MNTKEMIEVMKAFEDGKKIEYSPADSQKDWKPVGIPLWNWDAYDYRIAPEPKKEGRWERLQIIIDNGRYCISNERAYWTINQCESVPGFGGIDYQSPFDEKVIVRSMVPLMFEPCGVPLTAGHDDGCRPGIPVAAWFWREE